MKKPMLTPRDFRTTPLSVDEFKRSQEVIIRGDGGGDESYCTVYRYNPSTGKVDLADYTVVIKDIDFNNNMVDEIKQEEHSFKTFTLTQAVKEINAMIAEHDNEQFGGTYITVQVIPKLNGFRTRKPTKRSSSPRIKVNIRKMF